MTQLMTTEEVAAYLRVTREHIQHLCKRGDLKHVRVGRAIRVRREWVEEYLKPVRRRDGHWNCVA